MTKRPWAAALLNVVPGLGYVYVNPRRVFGWMLLGGLAAGFLDMFDTINTVYYQSNVGPEWTPWVVLSSVLLWSAFVVDGALEAKRHNGNLAAIRANKK